MHFTETPFSGLFLIEPFRHHDTRGEFVKTYHEGDFKRVLGKFRLREEFFSVSNRNVLRGMHFQTPPFAHNKLIYCIQGNILDVLLDLRKNEPTYGKTYSIELSASNRLMIWIPVGFAHGFLSLADDSCVIYKTDREHNPAYDQGIRWDSFGLKWRCNQDPFEISQRDLTHPPFADFDSPF